MAYGVGYWHARSDDLQKTVDGVGLALDVAVGHAIIENLILFGELMVSMHPETTHSRTYGKEDDTMIAGLFGFGAGLAYYIMPVNVYFSGTLAVFTQPDDRKAVPTPPDLGTGFGGKLAAGKDWWVSTNWSLGAAAELVLAGLDGRDSPKPGWLLTTISALFVATFN
jgi:hypothetical protein